MSRTLLILTLLLLILISRAYAQCPSIFSLSPVSGSVGSALTIKGNNFNATTSANIVWMGGVRASVNSASATQLVVTIPAGAAYQPVSVTNTANGLTGYSSMPFLPVFGGKGTLSSSDMETNVDIPGSGSMTAIVIADIDGDGKADIIGLNPTGNTLSVFRNTSGVGSINSNSMSNRTDLGTNATASALAVGDLNGDGKADVVVVYQGLKTVSVYLNNSLTLAQVCSGYHAGTILVPFSEPEFTEFKNEQNLEA